MHCEYDADPNWLSVDDFHHFSWDLRGLELGDKGNGDITGTNLNLSEIILHGWTISWIIRILFDMDTLLYSSDWEGLRASTYTQCFEIGTFILVMNTKSLRDQAIRGDLFQSLFPREAIRVSLSGAFWLISIVW